MLPTSIPELEEFIAETKTKEELEGSILTIPTNNNITIFPNPANENIHIKSDFNSISQIIISDIYGKKAIVKEGNYYSVSIETRSLNKGIYLVLLLLENGEMISQKIIIDN